MSVYRFIPMTGLLACVPVDGYRKRGITEWEVVSVPEQGSFTVGQRVLVRDADTHQSVDDFDGRELTLVWATDVVGVMTT